MSRATRARQRARELYAESLESIGPAWSNTAGLIRTGWENCWVRPAIDALQLLVLLSPDGEDESAEEGRPTAADD